MAKKNKARVSEETFDEFLAEQGMLGTCEERAIKEIIAEQLSRGGLPGPDDPAGMD
jgi:hypothetical protein